MKVKLFFNCDDMLKLLYFQSHPVFEKSNDNHENIIINIIMIIL